MRRMILAMVVVAMAAAVAAPATALAGVKHPSRHERCSVSPGAQREYAALAQYVVASYETVAPEDASAVLRREIRKAAYFGRLTCFVTLMERQITRVATEQGEDAAAAVAWFRAVVALNT
jgi:hypothetical protein